MKTKTFLFILAAIFLSSTIRGQIIHVPADHTTIQAAICLVTDGAMMLAAFILSLGLCNCLQTS